MVITKIQPTSHHDKFKTGKQEGINPGSHSDSSCWSNNMGTFSGNSRCNQTINSAAPGYAQLPKITGSVNVGQTVKGFMNDNLKVSFLQATEIATKQITNGTVVGGHLEVVQGYLVSTFFVVNAQNKIGYLRLSRNHGILY
jgi:hypothetical protein